MNLSVLPITNPFSRRESWGRTRELGIIGGRLLTNPSQSVAIIGEPFIGKSSLVKRLMRTPLIEEQGKEHKLTFIYLDCQKYKDLLGDLSLDAQMNKETSPVKKREREKDIENFVAALFWWDLYKALPSETLQKEQFDEPRRSTADDALLNTIYTISSEIEKWVQGHSQPVIFIFDDFEGIARLPLRNSDRLRSMVTNGAFVITSRYALYALYSYHPESWEQPSPFYNIFSDPIYLGLLSEIEVQEYLESATRKAREAGSQWQAQDVAFIRKSAGRHPELLRIACSRLFEERLLLSVPSKIETDEQYYAFLSLQLMQDSSTLCKQLWEGLANPELYGYISSPSVVSIGNNDALSPYQRALIEIAHGNTVSDTKILFQLDQRGLIERSGEGWSIFSEIMQQFVLTEEEVRTVAQNNQKVAVTASNGNSPTEREDGRAMTYMEGKVYNYLKEHAGSICDRADIMQAVWQEENKPTMSALQKIIERIREKIEDEPDSPYTLIAVRGRGYMLRKV